MHSAVYMDSMVLLAYVCEHVYGKCHHLVAHERPKLTVGQDSNRAFEARTAYLLRNRCAAQQLRCHPRECSPHSSGKECPGFFLWQAQITDLNMTFLSSWKNIPTWVVRGLVPCRRGVEGLSGWQGDCRSSSQSGLFFSRVDTPCK
jgi:hypothetical protein